MTQQQFLQAYRSLPDEAKRQVADFAAFLQQKYQTDQPEQQQLGKRFENEPFIGMWQDNLILKTVQPGCVRLVKLSGAVIRDDYRFRYSD
jgi:hypothetical protein